MRTRPRDARAHAEQIASLVEAARLNGDYVALVLGSCAIATFGLLENSVAVIIGAMLIAPFMTVIQTSAYGALEGSAPIFWRAFSTLAAGAVTAVAVSALLAKGVGISAFGNEILSRTRPNLLDLGIALAAGGVAGFAKARPSLSSSLAGTAIAVALLPPLCVVGIGLAHADWQISGGAGLLFATNLLGIALASMAVFLLTGFATLRDGAAVAWTLVLTAVIVVPLTLSFRELVREATLQDALRRALTAQTETFRRATLVSSTFDWLTQPPTATLLVRSSEAPSPHQVSLLEAFAQRATGQPFRLVMDVSPIERVTSPQVLRTP